MRKLFLGSIGLMLLSISILLFQISCQKTVVANNNSINQLKKIVYIKAGDAFPIEIWIANTDGTTQAKVPISLPAGLYLAGHAVCLTSDGNTVIFDVSNRVPGEGGTAYIYSCSTDGTNLKKIVDNTTTINTYFTSVNAY